MSKTSLVSSKIIAYITDKGNATPKELIQYLEVSAVTVFTQLKKLVADNVLSKSGSSPRVIYSLNKDSSLDSIVSSITYESKDFEYIQKNYLYISPSGNLRYGLLGFIDWCKKTNQPYVKTAQEYIKVNKKLEFDFKKNNLIDATQKIKDTFKDNNTLIKALYYADFYSIPRFGKTKLGSLVLYAKQNQKAELFEAIASLVKPALNQLLKQYTIDAVAFVPPSVVRKVQLQK